MTNFVSWVEIPTENFSRAVSFYKSVFNTDLEVNDFGNEKMACFPNGEGAIIYSPNYKPGDSGILVSFKAEKGIDGTIESIIENNGKIIQPKTKIEAEGKGYFAVFIDSEGNKAGIYGDN